MHILVTRSLGVAAAIAIAVSTATVATAHDNDGRKWRKSDTQRTYVRRKPTRKVETMDDINANSYDPSCNYCGYPSWARAALAPKDGGGRN